MSKFLIKFGKHKGEDISEVPLDYLQWVSSNMEGALRDASVKEIERRGEKAPRRKPVSVEKGIVDIDKALKRILAKLSGIEKALNIDNPYEHKSEPAQDPDPDVSGDFGSKDDDSVPF